MPVVCDKKVDSSVTMATADQILSVLDAPIQTEKISLATDTFMRSMEKACTDVKVTSTEAPTVDGHQAKATYGRAMDANKMQITFVNVVIKAETRNHVINALTAVDSDPLFVLPRVNAVIDTFAVVE